MSDSQAAVGAITSTTVASTTVLDATMVLQELTRLGPVQLAWTMGHANCTASELADALACIKGKIA